MKRGVLVLFVALIFNLAGAQGIFNINPASNTLISNSQPASKLTTFYRMDTIKVYVYGAPNWIYVQRIYFEYEDEIYESKYLVVDNSTNDTLQMNVYQRDDQHRIISKINFDGADTIAYFYTYDENGNLITRLRQVFRDTAYQNVEIDSMFYDSQNYLVLEKSYSWDQDSSIWEPDEKYEYEYDESGQKITELYSYWDEISSSWQQQELDSFFYENSYLVLTKRYFWDTDQNNWVLNEGVTYLYDDQGNLVEYYNWDYDANTQQIEVTHREKYYYDQNGNLIYDTVFTDGDQYLSNDAFTYDENGNMLSRVTQRWQSDQWVNTRKEEEQYLTDMELSRLIRCEELHFENLPSKNLPSQGILYQWDSSVQDWVPQIKFVAVYSTIERAKINEPASNQLKIYPNPASDVIHITLHNMQNPLVTIYDANGRAIRTTKLVAGQVSIKSLPTGTYFLIVRDKNQIYIGKFLKK